MKGITLPCSKCKQILLRFANLKGEGSFEMICPHCETLNKVEITQKTVLTASIITAFFLVLIGSLYISFAYGADEIIAQFFAD